MPGRDASSTFAANRRAMGPSSANDSVARSSLIETRRALPVLFATVRSDQLRFEYFEPRGLI
jgi:hypothetical protein